MEETRLKVFEKRIFSRIYGPCIDTRMRKWRKRHTLNSKNFFKDQILLKRRSTWAGHVWRKINSIIRKTIKDNPTSKRQLQRPLLQWEDCVIANVGRI